MKRMMGLFLAMAAVLLLAGCQPTPETEAVTSKNDGAFEAALQNTAEPDAASAAEAQTYTASFTSTDGTASYTLAVEVETASGLPVLRAVPEPFTGETAESIAAAIFGDTPLYEYSDQISREEAETKILEYKALINDHDTLLERADGDEESIPTVIAIYEELIAMYEEVYADAPETVEAALCDFTFHDALYYYPTAAYEETAEQIVGTNSCILATAAMNGVSYSFDVENETSSDEQSYSVTCIVDDILGGDVAEEGSQALLAAAAEEPTDEEIMELLTQAQEMIDAMGVGDWVIDGWKVYHPSAYDSVPAYYYVTVSASPVYSGLAVTTPVDVYSVWSGGDDIIDEAAVADEIMYYAPQYDEERMVLDFVGGQLTYFSLNAPLTVSETVSENVQTLSVDEIMEKFQTQMELRGAEYYAGNDVGGIYFTAAGQAEITVDSVTLGLARIDVPNREYEFYLVPAYTFYGSISMTDNDGNPVLYLSEGYDEQVGAVTEQLLVLNAVDGSVIASQTGQ